jgi:hypothetical protein
MRPRPARRWVVLLLALLLGYVSAEEAIHSVHLLEPDGGTSCPVLSASQHVAGALTDIADLCLPIQTAEPAPAVGAYQVLPGRDLGPSEGRAPPSPPSA